MSLILYKVNNNLNSGVQEIKCSRLTDSSYWAEGSPFSNRRFSVDYWTFTDKQEAINHLIYKIKSNIQHGESIIEHYSAMLENTMEQYKNDLHGIIE
jgi:hypothetical protein